MFYIAKLARRLARLRLSLTAFPMLSLLCLVVACAAGEPTGISTESTPALPDAPVVVSPRVMTIEGTQQVLFRAYEADLTTQVTSIEWTASGGSIAGDGTYSSSTTGDFRVVGKRVGNPHNLPDTSAVKVVAVQTTLAGVVVSPSGASVIGGQQQQYTAAGLMSDGSTVAIGVTWSATGGTIDVGGLFMAGNTGGTFQVIATHVTTGIADTVPVTVRAVQSIALSPTSASLSTGGTKQFAVTGTLSDGSTASLTTVGYSASGGTIGANGLYTAPLTAGSYTVKAQLAPGTGTGPSATAAVTVIATTSTLSPSTTYPNLPSGLTRLAENGFSNVPGSGASDEYIYPGGSWSRSGSWNTGSVAPRTRNWGVTTDVTAPQSASSVLQYVWPQGLTGGSGTGFTFYADWLTPFPNGVKELYVSWRMKIPTADFETNVVMTKMLGYVSYGSTTRRNQSFTWYAGPNYTGHPAIYGGTVPFGTFVHNLGSCVGNYYPNGSGHFDAARWHQVEIYEKLNSVNPDGTGNSDGIYRVWVDGNLEQNLTAVLFVGGASQVCTGANAPPSPDTGTGKLGFYQLHYDPIWGGTGGTKTRDDFLWIDHVFVAGR
jgi:hypothetical protein